MSLDGYNQANGLEKKDICKDIIETILKSGGRFLKKRPNDGNWIEIHDDDEILDRVVRGFRNARSRKG